MLPSDADDPKYDQNGILLPAVDKSFEVMRTVTPSAFVFTSISTIPANCALGSVGGANEENPRLNEWIEEYNSNKGFIPRP